MNHPVTKPCESEEYKCLLCKKKHKPGPFLKETPEEDLESYGYQDRAPVSADESRTIDAIGTTKEGYEKTRDKQFSTQNMF